MLAAATLGVPLEQYTSFAGGDEEAGDDVEGDEAVGDEAEGAGAEGGEDAEQEDVVAAAGSMYLI
jgi:hypothetical protein